MIKIAKIRDSFFVDPKLEEQLILPFDEFRPVYKKKELTLDSFIDGLKYGKVKEDTNYWESIKVKTDVEYFKRWVFAFCSIHTTWENNVRGYNYLTEDMSWTISKDRLMQMINESSLGLTSMRYKALWDFARKFRANPRQFYKKKNETWQECRNRLVGTIYGLGSAKTTPMLLTDRKLSILVLTTRSTPSTSIVLSYLSPKGSTIKSYIPFIDTLNYIQLI